MQKTFNCYSDPGHGWAKVPLKVIKQLGIQDKITTYSYLRGDYVYLEEDCDLSLFIAAMKKHGVDKINWRGYSGNKQSRIRGYDCYAMHKVNWDAI